MHGIAMENAKEKDVQILQRRILGKGCTSFLGSAVFISSYSFFKHIQYVGQKPVAVFGQGIFPFEERPVIEQCALIHGIDVHQLCGRAAACKFSAFQSGFNDLGDPLEIEAFFVGQGFLVFGYQLGRIQGSKQFDIDTVFDHVK